MQPKSQWSFKTDLSMVNFPRIISEANEAAGGTARCIRVTVDGKVYTLVAIELAIAEPKCGKLFGFCVKEGATPVYGHPSPRNPEGRTLPFRSPEGRVLIPCHNVYHPNTDSSNSVVSHVLYTGDVVKEHLDVVKTTVEVF